MKGTWISNISRPRCLAWRAMKPTMGGSRDGCNGTRHGALHIFTWNRKLPTDAKDVQLEKAM